jgi:very-short-patch-repair endonuclease
MAISFASVKDILEEISINHKILPIKFDHYISSDVKNFPEVKYEILVGIDSNEFRTKIACNRDQLEDLLKDITDFLAETKNADRLGVTREQAIQITTAYSEDALCYNCNYRWTQSCSTCLLQLANESARKLFLALKSAKIEVDVNRPLNRHGTQINIKNDVTKSNQHNYSDFLISVDFFIASEKNNLCLFVDHYPDVSKTEHDVTLDSFVDRKLQQLGFVVLRYTDMEINRNIEKIIKEIQVWLTPKKRW